MTEKKLEQFQEIRRPISVENLLFRSFFQMAQGDPLGNFEWPNNNNNEGRIPMPIVTDEKIMSSAEKNFILYQFFSFRKCILIFTGYFISYEAKIQF